MLSSIYQSISTVRKLSDVDSRIKPKTSKLVTFGNIVQSDGKLGETKEQTSETQDTIYFHDYQSRYEIFEVDTS